VSGPANRDAALAALLGDVLASDQPDAELLVRYAEDPQSLSSAERQAIELHLAQSPAYADQLRVLKQFDLSSVLAAEAPEATPSIREGIEARLGDVLGSIRRFFQISPVLAWSPAVAVAAVLALVLYPTLFGPGGESIGVPGPGGLQERGVPPASLPSVLDQATPRYRAPSAATVRPRTGLRGAGSVPALIALAPEHVGRTVSAQPSLHWYVSDLPTEEGEIWFTLADAESPDPLVRARLPIPSKPGVQPIDLSDYGVQLPLSVEYRWSVTLRSDPAHPAQDAVALGWLERVEAPASVAEHLAKGAPGAAPLIYAESGLWYDALSSLAELIERYPENRSVQSARSALLEQGGLEPIAEALAP
jgi:hypothetical protein